MLAFVLSMASTALPQGTPPSLVPIDKATHAAWRDHIAPLADEDRWLQIDWHDSISTGIKAATELERPMLLWLMNGHPLGCT